MYPLTQEREIKKVFIMNVSLEFMQTVDKNFFPTCSLPTTCSCNKKHLTVIKQVAVNYKHRQRWTANFIVFNGIIK